MNYDYSIMTHIMKIDHLEVLDDWIKFIAVVPKRLIAVTPADNDILERVKIWCKQRELELIIATKCDIHDIAERETSLLAAQFSIAGSDLIVLVKLDTFVGREGNSNWFSESIDFMRSKGAIFITGSTKPFRSDQITDRSDFLITSRVSNNFLVIEAPIWRQMQKREVEIEKQFGRFATEGAIENVCQNDNIFGVRRVNTCNWRVFHTQAWGKEANMVRNAIKSGGEVLDPFLQGYEDDLFGIPPWERYFMFPRPSRLKLLRIQFGKWRRNISRRFGNHSI